MVASTGCDCNTLQVAVPSGVVISRRWVGRGCPYGFGFEDAGGGVGEDAGEAEVCFAEQGGELFA